MIVSFAWTTPALLAGIKSATYRHWTDGYLRKWQAAYDRGQRRHQAYNTAPFRGGHQVGWITLTERPARKRLRDFTDAEVWAEGLWWAGERERVRNLAQMLEWMGEMGMDADLVVTLLRFTFEPLPDEQGALAL